MAGWDVVDLEKSRYATESPSSRRMVMEISASIDGNRIGGNRIGTYSSDINPDRSRRSV
jgi:hypothetical protein